MPQRRNGWRPSGTLLVLAWLVALIASYAWGGAFLSQLAEGIDLALMSKWRLVITLLALLGCSGLTFAWTYTREKPSGGHALASGRRRFLAGALLTLGGAVGSVAAVVLRNLGWINVGRHVQGPGLPRTTPNPRAEWRGAQVRAYRRLGRTEFRVSDISLGSGVIREDNDGEAIAREAIDRGINYFDTAPDYSGASSERALGLAIRGRRERMFLATKFCTSHGHLPAGSSVEAYTRAIEESLKRLQTDYVDLIHIHACDQLARLLDPNMHEAFERLRDQGKARFLGFSSHTPNLVRIADAAIEDGRFDVMMLAYHHGAFPELAAVVQRAFEADVGIVAMKTLKGGKHHGLAGFHEPPEAYAQAAFKWVLSNPAVSCLVVSFFRHQHLDEYLHASGRELRQADRAILDKYDRLIAGTHCFAHCGACLDSCPEQLAIHDVLRQRMYFEDYGWEKLAMQQYARLEKQADVCLGCAAPCVGACPHGIPIQERTSGTHRLLTLS